MTCADLQEAFRADPLAGWSCLPDAGFLRIRTPLRYSDGGLVELYAEDRNGHVVVSDFGEAFRFLQTYGLDPLKSAVRRQVVDLALSLGGAVAAQDTIEIAVESKKEIPAALLRLGQVVTRVADLALTAKGSFTATFPDAVEEFIRAAVPYVEIARNAPVPGRATSHNFDLVLHTTKGLSAVAALSAVSSNGAGAQTAFTIRKFADIAALGSNSPDRITVIDDSADVWSPSLRAELANYSDVIDWERRDELVAKLSPPRESSGA